MRIVIELGDPDKAIKAKRINNSNNNLNNNNKGLNINIQTQLALLLTQAHIT